MVRLSDFRRGFPRCFYAPTVDLGEKGMLFLTFDKTRTPFLCANAVSKLLMDLA